MVLPQGWLKKWKKSRKILCVNSRSERTFLFLVLLIRLLISAEKMEGKTRNELNSNSVPPTAHVE